MDCYFRQSWVDKRLAFTGYKVGWSYSYQIYVIQRLQALTQKSMRILPITFLKHKLNIFFQNKIF